MRLIARVTNLIKSVLRACRLQAADPMRWLVLVLAVLPAALFFALAHVSLSTSRSQYEQRAELLTQNLGEAIEQGLAANFAGIDLALGTVVSMVERRLRGGSLDLRDVDAVVQGMLARRADMAAIRITDAQGRAMPGPGLPAGEPAVSYADRDWFQAHRDGSAQGLVMSRPLVGKVAAVWLVSLSRRYSDADGRFAGTVVASVPLSALQTRLQAVNVGVGGFVTLRTLDLELVARHAPGVHLAEPPGSVTVSDTFRAVVRSGQPRVTYRSRNPIDNYERTNTLRRMKGAPLLVVVGLSSEAYLADWRTEVRTVASLSAAVVLLYAGGGMLMWRLRRQSRLARARIELLAKVFEHSGEAIMVTDRQRNIIEVNPAFSTQTGYEATEILGLRPNLVASSRNDPALLMQMEQVIADGEPWRGELWCRARDGHEYLVWLSTTALKDADGQITHFISSGTDLSEQKRVEDQIRHLAHHDTLTQLPNRVSLHARLEQAMALARRAGEHARLAMLFIDMDRFKNINDTLGHPVGDAMLVEVGRRLVGLVRSSDIVARLGGDEFVLVLNGLDVDTAAAAAVIADKVLAELGQPYRVHGHVLHSTPSIGIAMFPSDGADADTLLKNADAAMYQAKAAGRNNFQFYTEAMNVVTQERLALEVGLRAALAGGELTLHYQPQINMRSGRQVGVEALLRWHRPQTGFVAPQKFIPVAEDTGLILPIGAWVLDEALRQLAAWRREGLEELRISVNVSAQQLRGDGFPGLVAQALLRHGLPGKALELELTESVAMEDPARTTAMLRQLRQQGVALAIDDFGTGYSSLAYLKQLPLSCLKLDRSFVMDIESDPNDAAICTATIQLAHSLGLSVVAEGVETAAQLAFLSELGCDYAQGYHISRPLPAQQCQDFLQRAAAVANALA